MHQLSGMEDASANQSRTSATDVRGGRPRRTPLYYDTKTLISKEASAHTDGGNPVLRISSAHKLSGKAFASAYQPRTSAADVRGGHLRRTPPYFNTKTTISKEAGAHTDGGNPVLRISSAARKMQVQISRTRPQRTSAAGVHAGRPRRTPLYFNTRSLISKQASALTDGGKTLCYA